MTSADDSLRASRQWHGLGHQRYCDELLEQTGLLRSVVRSGVDLSTPVPTCPGWTLAHLVRHTGGAVCWAELMVRTQTMEEIPEDQVPGHDGPDSDDADAFDDWLAETAEMAADTLRAAGPDADVWSWSGDRTAGFWARRMTHEVAVHRADAALAARQPYHLAPEVAADTLDEWLALVQYAQRTATPEDDEPATELRGAGRSLHLHATDAPAGLDAQWLIDFDEQGFTWRRGHRTATAALRGPLTEVLLAFYRRRALDDGHVEVLGDRALLDFWLARATFG